MPLQLPPQRSLPDPDRMLHDIVSDLGSKETDRGRTRRVLAGVAVAAVAVGVTAVAVPLVIHRQNATVVAGPSSPTSSVASATPQHSTRPTPGSRPYKSTAVFNRLTVTVTAVDRSVSYGILVRARVCAVPVPTASNDKGVRVSWASWSVTTPPDRHSTPELRAGPPGAPPLTEEFPDGVDLLGGQCAQGWIPFNADEHAASVTVEYHNDMGDRAVWTD
jgi:hypothetical protein